MMDNRSIVENPLAWMFFVKTRVVQTLEPVMQYPVAFGTYAESAATNSSTITGQVLTKLPFEEASLVVPYFDYFVVAFIAESIMSRITLF